MPTWQSTPAVIETLEIATPVCALVRNDTLGGACSKLKIDVFSAPSYRAEELDAVGAVGTNCPQVLTCILAQMNEKGK